MILHAEGGFCRDPKAILHAQSGFCRGARMVFASRGHFENDSVGAPEWSSPTQVAISFCLSFAIPGLLNGETFRKLIAHGVCHPGPGQVLWINHSGGRERRSSQTKVEISFCLNFAIPGFLNGEALQKLIARGVRFDVAHTRCLRFELSALS